MKRLFKRIRTKNSYESKTYIIRSFTPYLNEERRWVWRRFAVNHHSEFGDEVLHTWREELPELDYRFDGVQTMPILMEEELIALLDMLPDGEYEAITTIPGLFVEEES